MKGFEQPVRPCDRKCRIVLGHEIKRVLVLFRIYTVPNIKPEFPCYSDGQFL